MDDKVVTLPKPNKQRSTTPMKPSKKAIELIKRFEGFRPQPYFDATGTPTIGYGTTFYPDGEPVSIVDPRIDEAMATKFLEDDVQAMGVDINNLVQVPLSQNEFDALCSFVYNVGAGAFSKSTLLRKLNSGDKVGAADQFLRWIYSKGKKLNGLARRREAERKLFLGDI